VSHLDDLRISVSQSGENPEVVILRLDGVIDTLTAPQLDKVMTRLLQQRRYKLVCDLSGIDYVSSAGWGIFISHIKEVRENQGDLKLAKMQPDVAEIFELLEFDTVIKSYDDLNRATYDFDGQPSVQLQPKAEPAAVATISLPQPPMEDIESHATKTSLTITKPAEPARSLEDKILTLVQEDPLLRISEIREQLKLPRFGEVRVSRLKIFLILRKDHLLRLRSRCLFARQAGKSF
jgi:anti-sigma B factor antagonist